jgi:predicted ATPase/DNA-binding SARP family transcriptional activator
MARTTSGAAEFRILGSFEVLSGGVQLSLGGIKQRAVLAMLVLHANEVVSVDRLLDELWDGEPGPGAITTLQVYISHLRRALSPLPPQPGADHVLQTRRPGYVLTVPVDAIDARRFEALVEEGTADSLRRALALWRGPALGDFTYASFAETEIVRLEELRVSALERRIDADLALGRAAELVPELEALVAEHPLKEAFRAQHMRALYSSGRRAEALRSYAQARERLADELGLDPGPGLQELERAILNDDASLTTPPAPPTAIQRTRPVGNVPASTTSFIGRQTELADIETLLGAAPTDQTSRLVTLTGAGGSGKTRLALEVAPELTTPAWLVDLAPIAGPADQPTLLAAVASAIGVRDDPDRPLQDTIADALADRGAVLVLDNCEHVLDAAANIADALLRQCPDLHIVATSQDTLNIAGEVVYRVPTLAVPDNPEPLSFEEVLGYDSVRLFVDRARLALPGFTPTPNEAAAICEICRRLDGIPLALELAAARLKVIGVDQVAARLDDRFRLLTTGSRAALPRQRTLRATVDWSYDLLPPASRLLFERLSVFAGVFALERAEAVCADDTLPKDEVVDALFDLVQRSLVVRVDAPDGVRYRLLETLRHYAAERALESGHAEDGRQRHADVFTELAEEASLRRQDADWQRWYDVLDAEHDDLRAALDWLTANDPDAGLRLAAALWPFWETRCLTSEGRPALARTLDRSSPDAPHRARATLGAAYLAYMDDDLDAALALADDALADDRATDADKARLLSLKADVARFHSNSADATALADEAAAVGKEGWPLANARRVQSLLAWDEGDIAKAQALAEEARQIWDDQGDLEMAAGVRSLLAGLAQQAGDLDRAVSLVEESLAMFRQARDPWGTAQAVRTLATLSFAAGDNERAYELGEESLAMHRDLGFTREVIESLKVSADAILQLGQADRAEALAAEAMTMARHRGFSGDLIAVLGTAASVAAAKGDLETAARLGDEAIYTIRESGRKRDAGPVLCLVGRVLARMGDTAGGEELCREALEVFHDAGDARGAAAALEALAEGAARGGDALRAAPSLRAASRARDAVGARLAPLDDAANRQTRTLVERAGIDIDLVGDDVDAEIGLIDLR